MQLRTTAFAAVLAGCGLLAGQTPPAGAAASHEHGWQKAGEAAPANSGGFVVPAGTRVPLSMLNSVSTKHSAEGDRVYLETVFPILAGGRVVIPPGSYVAGTLTHIKRPGRIRGRGELFLRFDSLTLPNGVTRDFRARVGALDGRASEELDRNEGAIKSEGNKGGDARTIGEATATGASVGVMGGAVGGHPGMGAAIGAAGGAAAGLMGVLLTRGPGVVLAKGSTLEMVLDRSLTFKPSELDFRNPMPRVNTSSNDDPPPSATHQPLPMPGRDWPW